MHIKIKVISDQPDSYQGKKGLVKTQMVVGQEVDGGENQLLQPVEYSMSEEEKPKFAGKLQGKTVTLAVRECSIFGIALRVRRGAILKVD